ncbi:MAG TPA: hypothetical protein VKU60_02420, partial [Chloroflexota bacterium]|nr:hypothetical protein [Chloroflexota bacterium]
MKKRWALTLPSPTAVGEGSLRFLSVMFAGLVLAACGGTAAPGSSTPASGAAGGSVATKAGSSWDQVVAAAKSEGKVVVFGPQGDEA